MNISYNWLREYVPVDITPEELADQLTMLGLEVDGLTSIGSDFEGIVVGEVLSVEAHPDADRLVVCEVNIGEEQSLQIVCGAPNVASGQLVPVATVGTTLTFPEDEDGKQASIKIKKAKIRGVASAGMICAEDELGLSEDHSGIMVLAGEASVGEPFATYLDRQGQLYSDTVFDIALTPNRPDAICHTGVARDIAALNKLDFRLPGIKTPAVDNDASAVSVFIDDTDGCKRYSAIIVRDVSIKDSPAWLANRLAAIGLRPRNNVVDITNYVMHELGQPLHAFDLDKLNGSTVGVRATAKSEEFVTLDGKERKLPAGTSMIVDGEHMVAIAGIMGGENSEVGDNTKNILIESAYFDPPTVRKVAKLLGMQTDASYRFERGVDPERQFIAAARAADLIAELGGGKIDDVAADVIVSIPAPVSIDVRPERVNLIAGTQIPTAEMVDILVRLGFEVTESDKVLRCDVPSYRHDVTREIDVVEEIARVFGYDNIEEPETTSLRHYLPRTQPEAELRGRVESILTGSGFSEIYTNSLISPDSAAAANGPELFGKKYQGERVMTANAISSEMSALRPSLLPGALGAVSHNINHGQEETRFFEFGHVFRKGDVPSNVIDGYIELESLCIAMCGSRSASWNSSEHSTDVFDVKGITETIVRLVCDDVEVDPNYTPGHLTSYSIRLMHEAQVVATIGCVGGGLGQQIDLEQPVYFAEINWGLLVNLYRAKPEHRYAPVNRFPVVSRDIAVIVAESTEVANVVKTVRNYGGKLLQSVNVFDIYSGKGIDAGKKSVALNIRFGADRTLTDKEVDKAVGKIVNSLSRDHDAILRQ
ncbi:MAG: phenylalanine--tRNA ligase subunit beta [Rhodothermales bacterium]|nr:phenylalanine--tRNA ligase subunit beta [Rhodothermales bacterium]